MLNISEDDPRLINFDKALEATDLSLNSKRLYRWQGKKILVDFKEKKVRPENLVRHAELYLRRLRLKGARSRSEFLQACSTSKILLPAVVPKRFKQRTIPKDILRNLQ